MGGIVLALILLLCYMFRKHSPGRWALAVVTAVFYLLSIEPVSNGLIHPLETAYDQPQGAAVDGDILLAQGPQRPMVQEIVLLPVHEAGHDLFDGMMAVSQG